MQQIALPFEPGYLCINFGRGDARGFQPLHERPLFIDVSLSSWSHRRSRPLRQLERVMPLTAYLDGQGRFTHGVVQVLD